MSFVETLFFVNDNLCCAHRVSICAGYTHIVVVRLETQSTVDEIGLCVGLV